MTVHSFTQHTGRYCEADLVLCSVSWGDEADIPVLGVYRSLLAVLWGKKLWRSGGKIGSREAS